MSSDFKDYVVAKFRKGQTYLFEAPAFSRLKAGDEIEVGGMERPVVIASLTLRPESEELTALKAACGVEDVPRIVARVKIEKFEYPDGEEVF